MAHFQSESVSATQSQGKDRYANSSRRQEDSLVTNGSHFHIYHPNRTVILCCPDGKDEPWSVHCRIDEKTDTPATAVFAIIRPEHFSTYLYNTNDQGYVMPADEGVGQRCKFSKQPEQLARIVIDWKNPGKEVYGTPFRICFVGGGILAILSNNVVTTLSAAEVAKDPGCDEFILQQA